MLGRVESEELADSDTESEAMEDADDIEYEGRNATSGTEPADTAAPRNKRPRAC